MSKLTSRANLVTEFANVETVSFDLSVDLGKRHSGEEESEKLDYDT